MSSKPHKEDKNAVAQVVPRCLVIALKTKKDRGKSDACVGRSGDGPGEGPGGEAGLRLPDSGPVPIPDPPSPPSGKALFENFLTENKDCYWNPHLEESIKNLKFIGMIHPNTLMVCGRDIYLDTVRNAWARRVLQAPAGFTIHRVGEINPLDMAVVQQTQFTPLPEALCLIIRELNHAHSPATLDRVQERLHDRYRGMQKPSEEIVYETLGSLLKERKIYHTGNSSSGYFIVTPDTYKRGCLLHDHVHPAVLLGEGNRGHLPTIYIPLLTPGATEMRSISCQTEEKEKDTEKENKPKVEEKEKEKRKSRLERSQSMKSGKGKEKKEKSDSLNRTASLRYSEEKAKGLVKDINLKTSDVHQDKDKGEKTSLFNKIFGRGKTRRATNPEVVGEDGEEEEDGEEAKVEVEYATFSAQFPPPEWAWYESQVTSLMGRQLPRSHTWHHMQGLPRFDVATQSDCDDEDYMTPLALPSNMNGFNESDHLQLPLTSRQRSSSSHSYESRSSSHDVPAPTVLASKHDVREAKTGRSKHKHRNDSKTRRHSHRQHSQHKHNVTNQHDRDDGEENGHIYCEPASPRNPYSYNPQYQDTETPNSHVRGARRKQSQPQVEEDRLALNIPSYLNGPPLNNSLRADSSIHTKPQSSPRPRQGHRHSRYKDLPCPTIYGNDISIEYNGKMPRRNTMYSLSRDSGVNCVGLADTSGALQSAKEKRLSGLNVLNNQTGCASRPVGGSSSATNLNNQTRSRFDTSLVRQSVHGQGGNEYVSHSHQDSGFSSPRTDNEFAAHNVSSDLFNSLPLASPPSNTLSQEAGYNGQFNSFRLASGKENSIERKPQGNVQKTSESGPSKDKENWLRHPAVSVESIPITSSEKYPSYGHLHSYDERDTNTTTSSSKSSSSKATVLERRCRNDSPNTPVSHAPRSKSKGYVSQDPPASVSVNESPYMEIQLLPECPLHGDQNPTSRNLTNQKEELSKRHSNGKHHTGQWDHHRSTGHRYHTSGGDPGARKVLEVANRGQHGASDPRLAFLGDCEVVGIV